MENIRKGEKPPWVGRIIRCEKTRCGCGYEGRLTEEDRALVHGKGNSGFSVACPNCRQIVELHIYDTGG